jgi:hypothetical protein
MKLKKIFLLTLVCSVVTGAVAAPVARGGRTNTGNSGGGATATASKTTSARATVGVRTAPKAAAATGGATSGRTTVARGGSAASSSTPKAPIVSARAATTQSVVGTGTKVSGAAQNTAIDKECQDLYNGCMDTFCVIENAKLKDKKLIADCSYAYRILKK